CVTAPKCLLMRLTLSLLSRTRPSRYNGFRRTCEEGPVMSVQKRPLGKSGLSTVPFSLGGNVFGWTADEKTSFAVLDRAVAAGVSLIDTADVYSAWAPGHKGGESETVLGAWLRARGPAVRSKVLVATKVGMLAGRQGLKASNIAAACDD